MTLTTGLKNYLISLGIILGMILIVSIFIIYPAFYKIISIKNDISAQEQELTTKLSQGLNAKKIKIELDETEALISKLDQVFIEKGRELEVLSFFENLSIKDRLSVTVRPDFNLQNIGNGIYKMPVDITASGSPLDLVAFLNKIDGAPFYFISDKLKISKADARLSLDLTGQIYIKDQKFK